MGRHWSPTPPQVHPQSIWNCSRRANDSPDHYSWHLRLLIFIVRFHDFDLCDSDRFAAVDRDRILSYRIRLLLDQDVLGRLQEEFGRENQVDRDIATLLCVARPATG